MPSFDAIFCSNSGILNFSAFAVASAAGSSAGPAGSATPLPALTLVLFTILPSLAAVSTSVLMTSAVLILICLGTLSLTVLIAYVSVPGICSQTSLISRSVNSPPNDPSPLSTFGFFIIETISTRGPNSFTSSFPLLPISLFTNCSPVSPTAPSFIFLFSIVARIRLSSAMCVVKLFIVGLPLTLFFFLPNLCQVVLYLRLCQHLYQWLYMLLAIILLILKPHH